MQPAETRTGMSKLTLTVDEQVVQQANRYAAERSASLLLIVLIAGCLASPSRSDGGTGGGTAAGGGAAMGGGTATGGGSGDAKIPPGDHARTLTAYPNRAYDLIVPAMTDGGALPAILMLHGGGGNRTSARHTSCPGGVVTSPDCLHELAAARGFLVVIPDGTGTTFRTWNSGGGANGWQCVSGAACTSNVDESAYFKALLADVGQLAPLDTTRVYATGLSNGASMSHRLACQFPEISAIASVAGGNQFSTTRPCTRTASVLEIHGTADACWNFDGGPAGCADPNPGSKISVPDTLARWATNNGCDGGEVTTMLPNTTADGTLTLKHAYTCAAAALELYEVRGGGHSWPGGAASLSGPTAMDWSANSIILDFFAAH